mmetsp:Transcript_30276/g.61737  ORF Transcript_30276/g.61737 Transcript_30276/m.61737 type:complete len:80 (+) Transcript_30276:239-478(+)
MVWCCSDKGKSLLLPCAHAEGESKVEKVGCPSMEKIGLYGKKSLSVENELAMSGKYGCLRGQVSIAIIRSARSLPRAGK